MAVSKPILWVGILAVAVVAFVFLSPEEDKPKLSAKAHKKVAKGVAAGWEFPVLTASVHYPKPTETPRDVFLPAVKVQPVIKLQSEAENVVQIPSGYAEGEGGWAYTGMAEVDGVRMALLENSGTKKSGYVREGDDWKKSHVVGITTACIVLSNEKGVSQTVYRFNPNDPPKVKPVPEGGFAPMNPGMAPPGGPSGGRIGGGGRRIAGNGGRSIPNGADAGVEIRPMSGAAAVSFSP